MTVAKAIRLGVDFPLYCWAVLAVVLVGSGAALANPGGTLWSAGWQLETWGFQGQGTTIWVLDGTSLRLDIATGGMASPGQVDPWESVWLRQGTGWTLVATGNGQGTLNPWGEPWRELPPFLAALTLAVSGALEELPNRVNFTRHLVVPPAPDVRGCSALRAELKSRGLGQGGGGELIAIAVGPDPGRFTLTSTRRPGELFLTLHGEGITLGEVAPELFAPLWPLADFLKFPAVNPEP
ncbi:hypothetical protein COW53_00910 [bacterium CG17_big_fil_post_rev_8_21_14_2_50_64_8]|nr:MAG: hypothetical protein COW53_00910 [bacterium CG17_big_fil_post_rev_8_21_14_2_50_64_8]PJA75607.1 MAG: hypothetical protein CO151_05300 [bacterium CG_4_9_14_3_um_filter_65_15]